MSVPIRPTRPDPLVSLLNSDPSGGPARRLVVREAEPSSSITARQRQVLYCLVEGKPTKRICAELGISEGTAKVHISAIFRALNVRNRTEATLAALQKGWIYPEMWSRA